MWLLVYVPAVFGILRHRHWPYWRWVGMILIWQSAAQFLFNAQGALEHPERDGLIMRAIRQATNDGPEIALVGLVFLAVFWGGVIYFMRRLYVASRSPDLGATAIRPTSRLRKAVELTVLTVLTGAMLYSNFAALMATSAGPTAEPARGAMTVEADIDRTVVAIEAEAPIKLDAVTTLTSASREGRVLVYDYQVSDPKITPESAATYLKDGITQQTCASDSNRRILDAGGVLRFRYALAAGSTAISRDFVASDCVKP